ncbi:MAG: hypothetical protein LW805_02570 [Oxalobacteraceae bacterium]|nr:hypothetical protein [Oxalobacteraceae bacterium]
MKKTTTTITAKQIAIAVAAVCASLSMPAVANENKAMLDLMLKKGVITQKDYDEFMQANKDADENKAFKDSRIDKDVSKSITFIQKRANDGAVKPSGFGWVSGDGKSELNLTGRIHMDTRFFNNMVPGGSESDPDAVNTGNQMDFRRARLGFTGKFWNDFNYEMVWNGNAIGGSGSTANIDTGWLNYSAKKESQFRIGRFKQPFNLEDYGTSSNNIDFIERSYVNQINPGKKLGMMIHGVPSDGTAYAFSLFNQNDSQTTASGHFQIAGRFATDLGKAARWTDKFLHVGVAGTSGSYDSGTIGASEINHIRSEPRGMNAFRPTFTTTGNVQGEITKENRGLEFAYGQGALKLQAEYAEAIFNARDNTTSLDIVRGKYRMQYVALLYNLTGEQWYDSYKDGAFSSLKIKSNFDPSGSGIGAWQVGIRFSSYDATDLQPTGLGGTSTFADVGSNKGKTTTLGLTWFINPNSRIMLNHAITHFDQPITSRFLLGATGGTAGQIIGDRESVTTLRAQYNF